MKISALVFDLDGTAVPNSPDGVPSEEVIKAVRQAQDRVSVSIATGRPITTSAHIFESLKVTAPSIISGGAQIYDPVEKRVIWEKTISKKTVNKIIEWMKPYPYGIYISDSIELIPASEIKVAQEERIIYLMNISLEDTKILLIKLSRISEISAHKVKSYTDGCFDIHITHYQATKKNAMQELLKILKVPQSQVMVVGDGHNDLPLFKSAGLKVAMGNGSEELKKQADYVAPSVKEDGLAKAIEKFILK
ncbi:HAD-IIB family hydrolase [Patescibacteria group bacterium]|nr:HAD-IIB family hydrolase [Patescibacteria group bacterium]